MHHIPEQMARSHLASRQAEAEVSRVRRVALAHSPGGGGRAPCPARPRGRRPGLAPGSQSPLPTSQGVVDVARLDTGEGPLTGRSRQLRRRGAFAHVLASALADIRRGPAWGRIGGVTHLDPTALDAAVAALTDPALAGFVAVVCLAGPGRRPRSALGSPAGGPRGRRAGHGPARPTSIPDGEVVAGRHPLPSTDPDGVPAIRRSRWRTRLPTTSATPTRCRGCGSRRSSPRQRSPDHRGRARGGALVPRAGRPPRRARVARRDPVTGAVRALGRGASYATASSRSTRASST